MAGVWAEVSRVAGKTPSMSFLIKAFAIDSIDGRVVKLSPRPGNRGFITERQQSQLAQLLGQILGHPVSLAIQQKQATTPGGDESDQPNFSDGQSQRQLAMQLPLVQQINELFDISLVELSDDISQTQVDENSEEDLMGLEEEDV